MIIRSAEFLKSGLKPAHFPAAQLPEIAFAGRSNVGKSSLINALLGRKSLVRTSRRPGQTRTLNFFLVNGDLVLVDLPGYGYSRASKEVISSYQQAMSAYLKTRKTLELVVLLLDIRRLPSEEDKGFLQLVRSSGHEPFIVLTKVDTVGRGAWKKSWAAISADLAGPRVEPVFFSAKTGQGKAEIWDAIGRRVEKEKVTGDG
jgi:GTP-binding protein